MLVSLTTRRMVAILVGTVLWSAAPPVFAGLIPLSAADSLQHVAGTDGTIREAAPREAVLDERLTLLDLVAESDRAANPPLATTGNSDLTALQSGSLHARSLDEMLAPHPALPAISLAVEPFEPTTTKPVHVGEPSSLVFLLFGLAGFGWHVWRIRRSRN